MKFALRYWWKNLWGGMVSALSGVWVILVIPAVLIVIFTAFSGNWATALLGSLRLILTPVVIAFILTGFTCMILTITSYDVYKVRNEKGFCLEYFYVFKDKFIIGKPKDTGRYIEFAEIYQQMGDYKSAINILNEIIVPESNVLQRISYLFVYINTALGMKDSALADDIWRKNQAFINSKMNRFIFRASYTGLDLLLASIDALNGRYERALFTCERNIKSVFKNYRSGFLSLRVYIYKKLGNEAGFALALSEAELYLKKYNPIFDSTRAEDRRELERAKRGEFPV